MRASISALIGFLTMVLVGGSIVIALTSAAMSCAWIHNHPAVEADIKTAIDCSVQAVRSEGVNLLPAVMAILAGAPADWEAELNALKVLGEDALACDLQQIAQQATDASLKASRPPSKGDCRTNPGACATAANPKAPSPETGDRARAFIAAHKYKFATVTP